MKSIGALEGLTNKLIFSPRLGLPPFSVVGDEPQDPRGCTIKLGPSPRGRPEEITNQKKIRKLLKMAPNSGALANEDSGLRCFDEILLLRIVSSC